MLEPRFRWSFPDPVEVDPAFAAIGQERGLSRRLIELLARRQVAPGELAGFFAQLVTTWQYAAYAHRMPARELLAQLIEDWARVCIPPQASADEAT